MSRVVLTRREDGKLAGLGDRGHRAFSKFKRAIEALPVGATLQFDYRLPRSPKHHRLFFAKVRALHDRQETFNTEEDLRMWLLVGAGYCTFLPGTDGQLVAVPQSMDWATLEEGDFVDVHQRVDAFVWEPRARRVLWPHLGDERTFYVVEQWREEFEKP
ncbi:hypothetical protein [Variovorax sp.]|uniref:hypothetical protein n=1 Tax=Variovorax sp. TaxID=1871043 RepID=UPI003BAA48BB